ncbi:hypothetical protein MPH_08556 [Macrophomina phaseolina MS6]|uniref:Uncharacterized protein n=1 Tax=Macrophomina phaseolina (strain MS6) TaxID=1126212 RepID=K2QWP3_MACPH|nr:hypothetical protein MPH_08556 [Macrophomina phaseolina MS6]
MCAVSGGSPINGTFVSRDSQSGGRATSGHFTTASSHQCSMCGNSSISTCATPMPTKILGKDHMERGPLSRKVWEHLTDLCKKIGKLPGGYAERSIEAWPGDDSLKPYAISHRPSLRSSSCQDVES